MNRTKTMARIIALISGIVVVLVGSTRLDSGVREIEVKSGPPWIIMQVVFVNERWDYVLSEDGEVRKEVQRGDKL